MLYEGYREARKKIPTASARRKMKFLLKSIFEGYIMKNDHFMRVTIVLFIRRRH